MMALWSCFLDCKVYNKSFFKLIILLIAHVWQPFSRLSRWRLVLMKELTWPLPHYSILATVSVCSTVWLRLLLRMESFWNWRLHVGSHLQNSILQNDAHDEHRVHVSECIFELRSSNERYLRPNVTLPGQFETLMLIHYATDCWELEAHRSAHLAS